MKKQILICSMWMITLISCSTEDSLEGYFNLGSNFRYIAAPSYSGVNHCPDPDLPWEPATDVILDIDTLGYNDFLILAVSTVNSKRTYWVIDKTKKTRREGYRYDSRLITTNLEGPLDSLTFRGLEMDNNIIMRPVSYYQKRLSMIEIAQHTTAP